MGDKEMSEIIKKDCSERGEIPALFIQMMLSCDETIHRTVSRHALATGGIGRINALLKTLDGNTGGTVLCVCQSPI